MCRCQRPPGGPPVRMSETPGWFPCPHAAVSDPRVVPRAPGQRPPGPSSTSGTPAGDACGRPAASPCCPPHASPVRPRAPAWGAVPGRPVPTVRDPRGTHIGPRPARADSGPETRRIPPPTLAQPGSPFRRRTESARRKGLPFKARAPEAVPPRAGTGSGCGRRAATAGGRRRRAAG